MSEDKLDRILSDTNSIKVEMQELRSAIWPDKNEPSLLTQHEKRLDTLESWRNWLAGAGAVISAIFGIHLGGGKH